MDVTKEYQILCDKVLRLGGIRIGKYKTRCKQYGKNSSEISVHKYYTVHLDDVHGTGLFHVSCVHEKSSLNNYALEETGRKSRLLGDACCIMETGREGVDIVTSLGTFVQKMDGVFDGTHYEMGDFRIGISIFKGRNDVPKGIVIELQYIPCSKSNHSKLGFEVYDGMFNELQHVFGNVAKIKQMNSIELYEHCNIEKDEFAAKHIALQYVAAFAILK